MAMVHLDARCSGVRVPDHLAREAHLRLNLSYKFDPPDLTVSGWGVRATLSFSGRRFQVALPWVAVFAITSHTTQEFWLFPEDMPAEVLERATESASAPPVRPALHEVRPLTASASAEDESPNPPGRRHLRSV